MSQVFKVSRSRGLGCRAVGFNVQAWNFRARLGLRWTGPS